MRLDRRSPESLEEAGDYYVLIWLKYFAQWSPRLATLEQHCVHGIIALEKQHCRVALEKPESSDLILGLEVGHSNLEDGRSSVSPDSGRNP
jgi:hypothetical protein